jgi:small-conductance mechanosensitive channel
MLDTVLLGNTLRSWLIAFGVAILVQILSYTFLRLVMGRLRRLAERTETDIDDLVTELLDKTKGGFIAIVSLWAGSLYLDLPTAWDNGLRQILVIGLLFQGAYWSNAIINYGLNRYKKSQIEEDPGIVTALGAIGFIVRVAVFSVFLLMGLANLGIEIGPLIASMGIGGIAVALAVKDVLGDLFASLSIVFDKPFVVGDFIQVGSYQGTVDHVGLKTSRLTSITGEQLVFNNSDLLGSRIQNYKRRQERRIAFTLGVTYDTPKSKLEKIPEIVRSIVEPKEHARFDRCFFIEFGDSAMIFEVVYYMEIPDYMVYGETRQAINLELVEAFEQEGIEFAFPSQTLYVKAEGLVAR